MFFSCTTADPLKPVCFCFVHSYDIHISQKVCLGCVLIDQSFFIAAALWIAEFWNREADRLSSFLGEPIKLRGALHAQLLSTQRRVRLHSGSVHNAKLQQSLPFSISKAFWGLLVIGVLPLSAPSGRAGCSEGTETSICHSVAPG